MLCEEDTEKLNAQKSDQNSAQTHLFEAKNGSKERTSCVEPIERKLSTTSKEQQGKVENKNPGKVATARSNIGQIHYKKEEVGWTPRQKEERQKVERRKRKSRGGRSNG